MDAAHFQRLNALLLSVVFGLGIAIAVIAGLCFIGAHSLPDMAGVIDWEASSDNQAMNEVVSHFLGFTWLRHTGWLLTMALAAGSVAAAWWGMAVLALTAYFVKDDGAPSTKLLSAVVIRLVALAVLAGSAGAYAFVKSGIMMGEFMRAPFGNMAQMAETLGERDE